MGVIVYHLVILAISVCVCESATLMEGSIIKEVAYCWISQLFLCPPCFQ